MKIAIIGSGQVGTALGEQLSKKNHKVIYGVRDLKESRPDVALVSQAIDQAEIVFLCIPWKAAYETVSAIPNWNGKILVDCTNPINAAFNGLEIGQTTSGGEQIQLWAKGAKVVKCFNQTGFENMAQPEFGKIKPMMFAASDFADEVKVVAKLAQEIGFEAVELPALSFSRQLEQLAWLWIYTALKTHVGRKFAFGILRN